MYNVFDFVLQTFFEPIIACISRQEGSQMSTVLPENLRAKASILMDTIIDIHSKTSKHNGKQAMAVSAVMLR